MLWRLPDKEIKSYIGKTKIDKGLKLSDNVKLVLHKLNGEHAAHRKKMLAACVLRVRSMQAANVQHAYCKRTFVRIECLRMRIFGTKRACNMLAASMDQYSQDASDVCILATSLRDAYRMFAGSMHTLHMR